MRTYISILFLFISVSCAYSQTATPTLLPFRSSSQMHGNLWIQPAVAVPTPTPYFEVRKVGGTPQIIVEDTGVTINFTDAEAIGPTEAAVLLGGGNADAYHSHTLVSGDVDNTVSGSFTINSDNATADTENAQLEVERGTTTPNAIIGWDAVNDEWDINQDVNVAGSIEGTNLTDAGNTLIEGTLNVQGNTTLGNATTDTTDINGDLDVTDGNLAFSAKDGGVQINVAAPTPNQDLLNLKNNGASKWKADEDGDVAAAGSLTHTGGGTFGSDVNITGAVILSGDATVGNNITSAGGELTLGADLTTQGKITAYGNGTTEGGRIILENADSENGNTNDYNLEADGDDIKLVGEDATQNQRLLLHNSGTGAMGLSVEGTVTTGTQDGIQGSLTAYGAATTDGAKIILENAGDEDGTVDSWIHEASGICYTLGPDTNPDAFFFSNDGALVADGPAWFKGGDIIGGLDDSEHGQLVLYGPSTGQGATIQMYNHGDDDTTLERWIIRADGTSLSIYGNTVDDFLFGDDGSFTAAGDIEQTGTTVQFKQTDTTESAKDLLIKTDGDFTFLQENSDTDGDILTLDLTNARVGIGTAAPANPLHIKANTPGTVGSHPAGQLIIQDPDDSVFGNAVITGYESDGSGNPDQQLWYIGSTSVSNNNFGIINRRSSAILFSTDDTERMRIDAVGAVGIGTLTPGTSGDDNLAAGWHFNEGSGTLDNYEGTAAYDLTTFNTPTYGATGRFTDALTFASGSSEYAEVDSGLGIAAYPVTMMCWMKTTGVAATQCLMWLGDKDDPTSYLVMNLSSLGRAEMRARNTTAYTTTSSIVVDDGNWHHIVAVFSSATVRNLYVDGVLVDDHEATSVTIPAGIDRFSFGRYGDVSPAVYYNGTADEVAVYSAALTEAQIQTYYRNGASSTHTNGETAVSLVDAEHIESVVLTARDTIYQQFDGDISRPVPVQENSAENPRQVTYYGTDGDGTVTFTTAGFRTAFAAAPVVVLTALVNADVADEGFVAYLKTTATTGFTYEIRAMDSGVTTDITAVTTVHWVAHGYVN